MQYSYLKSKHCPETELPGTDVHALNGMMYLKPG